MIKVKSGNDWANGGTCTHLLSVSSLSHIFCSNTDKYLWKTTTSEDYGNSSLISQNFDAKKMVVQNESKILYIDSRTDLLFAALYKQGMILKLGNDIKA